MTARILCAVCLLLASGPGTAQTSPSNVTLKMPLNLTKLATDITKVAVTCIIGGPGGSSGFIEFGRKQEEFPVSGGQVVQSVTVVVPVNDTSTVHLADASGKNLVYACTLTGFSGTLQRWDSFNEAHPVEVFRMSPTPQAIQGTFVW